MFSGQGQQAFQTLDGQQIASYTLKEGYITVQNYEGIVTAKEVNKEQPSYRNLSATATRVLQCTCPVAASWKYFSAILNNYNGSLA
jgi:hypothetical protein